MTQKSILYIITRSDVVGGASIHLVDLIRHANQEGYQVNVAVGGEGEFSRYLRDNEDCQVYCLTHLKRELHLSSDARAIREIRTLIKSLSPDIVHLHSAKAGLVGRLATIGLSVPRIFTVHGWPFTDGIPVLRRAVYLSIEWFMSWLPTYVITVSKQDREQAERYHFANMDKMFAIQNGVAPSGMRRCFEASGKAGELRFTMVARFDTPKSQKTVIQALALCRSSKLRVSFVGDGPSLDSCRELATSLGVEDRVDFHGYLEPDEVRNVLAQSDGFLLISDWEGLPLTILEAMSTGVAVIASDVGGVNELIDDGQSGYLIPREGRVERLTEVFEHYIEHPELVRVHGERGLSLYRRHFTLDIMLAKTFELYQKARK
ncbi:glycosyltransferase family 4 protein [Vibrio sp. 10N]|uniref:glycosyltransferase family 4 protein n=1 Tax=Vibrio sp. 10N TaxID=3058938 RepID=UPI002812E3E9|nr:glycosyltransferase family 4 protein [Vibrio sp. 10N]